MRKLTVYFSPSCAFSAGTFSFLMLRGADFEALNLDEHPDVRARLEERLGEDPLETPTLEVGGALHVAPSLSKLKKLLQAWRLPTDAAPHEKLKEAEAASPH